MKHLYKILAIGLAAFLAAACCSTPEKEPVDYVNPYIGNISHLLVPTFPTVQLPNSMLRVYPERSDYTSEYVNGLPIIVTNHRERSAFKLNATQRAELRPVLPVSYDNEHLTPYSYETDLDDGAVTAKMAVDRQSGIYNIRFNDGKGGNLLLSTGDGEIRVKGNVISGWQRVSGQTKVYVCLETEAEPVEAGILKDGKITDVQELAGRNACVAMKFEGPQIRLRYGVSYISEEQAAENLKREQTDFDVEALAAEGRKIWNEALGRIDVKGGTDDQKEVFYTSYYRTFERPICISEDGRYWSAEDNSVHEDGGTPYYTDDWIWDTYRAAHPLRVIMNNEIEEDILASFLRMSDENGKGWIPTFPEVNGDSRRMNSNHTIATFADALAKGLDVDYAKAYDACKGALTEKTLAPWCGNPAGWIDEFYWEKGYIPALAEGEKETDPNVHHFEKRQPVAVTLGTSYDSWCLSKLAEAAGDMEGAKYFAEKALNYRNLYNSETAFFHPKDSRGNFIEPFNYSFSGGMGAREYYGENNAYVYRWDVQHNVADLVKLMGGQDKFIANLDATFATPLGRSKYEFYSMIPDHTGNVGQFSMANEPSLHVPYLYNYAGAPWKAQKRIRQMLDTWFRNDLMGVPGDEDGGGMTSFVVFSSLGIYPVTPGMGYYNIGSPLFEESTIDLCNGNTFTIKAEGTSRDNKYIQSATLNGEKWNKPYISHEDLMNGGELVLVMGDKPNRLWGANDVPPSMNDIK